MGEGTWALDCPALRPQVPPDLWDWSLPGRQLKVQIPRPHLGLREQVRVKLALKPASSGKETSQDRFRGLWLSVAFQSPLAPLLAVWKTQQGTWWGRVGVALCWGTTWTQHQVLMGWLHPTGLSPRRVNVFCLDVLPASGLVYSGSDSASPVSESAPCLKEGRAWDPLGRASPCPGGPSGVCDAQRSVGWILWSSCLS